MKKTELFFLKLIGKFTSTEEEILPKEGVKKILILRNNNRIGNMYFLLPFINSTQDYYKNAKIDVMVKSESQKQVFENLNLNKIISLKFSWKNISHFIFTIKELRKSKYDIVFMPYCSSTDRIISALVDSRNKIAINNEKNNILFKNTIKDDLKSPHAALSSLYILHSLGYNKKEFNHQMRFTKDEREFGEMQANVLKGNERLLISYFRGARGKKIISDTLWKEIINKTNRASVQTIQWVEILSPDISTPLITEHATFQTKNLRQLGAMLTNVDLFLCADTGPLHLADAAGANCVGLFNATSSEYYGCLGKNTINIDDIERIDVNAIFKHFGLGTYDQVELRTLIS
tara:strand:- start:1488 stop:2525 length:1038 start_codon:yes stop_codon:yes gene_type:complete